MNPKRRLEVGHVGLIAGLADFVVPRSNFRIARPKRPYSCRVEKACEAGRRAQYR
jgi:hypothetical protein